MIIIAFSLLKDIISTHDTTLAVSLLSMKKVMPSYS